MPGRLASIHGFLLSRLAPFDFSSNTDSKVGAALQHQGVKLESRFVCWNRRIDCCASVVISQSDLDSISSNSPAIGASELDPTKS